MSLRISQIGIQFIVLDEHDAPRQLEPVVFVGDASGPAIDKAKEFLADMPAKLEAAEGQLADAEE